MSKKRLSQSLIHCSSDRNEEEEELSNNGKSRSVHVFVITANLISLFVAFPISDFCLVLFFRWEGGETDCESDSGGSVSDFVGVHSCDWPRHYRYLLHVSLNSIWSPDLQILRLVKQFLIDSIYLWFILIRISNIYCVLVMTRLWIMNRVRLSSCLFTVFWSLSNIFTACIWFGHNAFSIASL